MKKIITDISHTGICGDDIQELVLGLPDGILSRDEEAMVFDHLANCRACRGLLQSYMEYREFKKKQHDGIESSPGDRHPWLDIPIAVAMAGIRAIDSTYLHEYPRAHVLSDKPSNMLEYRIPVTGGESLIRIFKGNESLDVEIETGLMTSRFYLMQGDDMTVSSPDKGVVSFTGVPLRNFLISMDMKEFFSISISKE